MEVRHCDTCMHETLPSGIAPCNSCTFQNEWKPKVAEPAVGIDPGAPEGDRTNVRLDYAIAGVRSKMSSIGIKLTDKDLSRDEIGFMIGQLNALQADLFELEEDRERKLRGAADVEIKDRDS